MEWCCEWTKFIRKISVFVNFWGNFEMFAQMCDYEDSEDEKRRRRRGKRVWNRGLIKLLEGHARPGRCPWSSSCPFLVWAWSQGACLVVQTLAVAPARTRRTSALSEELLLPVPGEALGPRSLPGAADTRRASCCVSLRGPGPPVPDHLCHLGRC